jgi:proteasome-associated ATPase
MPRSVNSTATASSHAQNAPRAPVQELLVMLRDAPEALRPALITHLQRDDPGSLGDLLSELLKQQHEARQALAQADRALVEHQRVLAELTRPPLLEAGVLTVNDDGTYHVALGGGGVRQEVTIHPDLQGAPIRVGDAVALAQDGHVIVKRLDQALRGRVATVRGWHRNQLLVEYQSEHTLAVAAAAAVMEAGPRPGDRVLVHEGWQIALALLEREETRLDGTFDPVRPDRIGGLDDQLDEILLAVEARLLDPARAAEIGLEPLGGLILEGPPGTGKTLLARALATILTSDYGQRVRFLNVAPGSWRDPYYGVSDHKVVAPIDQAEQLLDDGEVDLVILFYDELDTLGARSADVTSRIDSRVLSALLHRMDGVAARYERRRMLFIGATNRTDLLDEALLRPGRFGDLILQVPRPGPAAARAIFRCHLAPEVRFHTNGAPVPAAEMVERCADAAVGRLFADADPADALAELVLAGGQRRLVYRPEVLSGALIASLVRRAKRTALRRGLYGPPGLVPDDFAQAADAELEAIAARLRDPLKIREILGDRTLAVAHGIPRRRSGSWDPRPSAGRD